MASYDRLGALDASFLHLERLETPMHVGALSVFEGGPFFDEAGRFRLADARELVGSRLHLIPRFRRRIMDVPLAQGRPVWVDDERFDITYHVRLTALPAPGSREQLLTLCARIQAQLLDRSRPLWELWFVEGLAGGHVALIQKTHHALVDGVSGVDVATVLLDFTPEPTPADAPPWVPAPGPAAARLLSDSVCERFTRPTEMARSARAAVRGPRRAVEHATRLARSMSSIIDRNMVAPRTSLHATVGRSRRLETVRVPLDGVKAVRRALGGTVNDVILAGVAGGLRRLLESRGDDVEGLTLRVMCPVSVRGDDEHMQLGNRVSGMFVSLPVGQADPIARLEAIRDTTADLKEKEQAVGAAFLVDLTEYAAPTLLGLAARAVHHQPFFNLIITNVPGPQVPLYCMGARMLEAFPIVPLSGNLSVVVGILSYCGELHFGLFADREACTDLLVLAGAIEDAFVELSKLAEQQEGIPS
ncbi:MAG TPA: wax ester/triacylglycerol synthase family O-acyltransferase [Acidimicrobiia bacterium]|nr:wax ester/triacylglycerol synthase family O-acyltransferase [Acidimicrobiia bacterium]